MRSDLLPLIPMPLSMIPPTLGFSFNWLWRRILTLDPEGLLLALKQERIMGEMAARMLENILLNLSMLGEVLPLLLFALMLVDKQLELEARSEQLLINKECSFSL